MKPVEIDVTEVPALDPAHLETAAVAVGGAQFELAGAVIRAIATAERQSVNSPLDHGALSNRY